MVLHCIGVLTLGTIANSIIGALTGLLGSLIWQHESYVIKGIVLIGGLAGGIGGLLHAIIIVHGRENVEENTVDADDDNFRQVFTRVFSQAPCWSAIGASIGFWIMKNTTDNIGFTRVVCTALSGTLAFAIYAVVMCWLTESPSHLLLLQNHVLVLAKNLGVWSCKRSHSQKPYHPLMPEFDSSLEEMKQVVIELDEKSQLITLL